MPFILTGHPEEHGDEPPALVSDDGVTQVYSRRGAPILFVSAAGAQHAASRNAGRTRIVPVRVQGDGRIAVSGAATDAVPKARR